MQPSDTSDAARSMTRRRALLTLGGAGLGTVGALAVGRTALAQTIGGGSGGTGSTGATTAAGGTCTLSPEMTEGPYYVSNEPVRSDIREDRTGVPLALQLTVQDVATCTALPNATVDIWHADATGNYSNFSNVSSSTTFLRGQQPTDSNGLAPFTTVYPGWYMGRAVHIHVKVHFGSSSAVVHTGQLFFDDSLTDTVFTNNAPYSTRGARDTRNAQDDIFANGGSASLLTVTADGSGGYVGTATLAVSETGATTSTTAAAQVATTTAAPVAAVTATPSFTG
jgi:protocatechuate 3,4-dioxygenase beta subunit